VGIYVIWLTLSSVLVVRYCKKAMKLVVGLGNPGKRYEGTRHNIGFLVLDELKARIAKSQIPKSKQSQNLNFKFQKRMESEVVRLERVVLAKPQTFMNRSGEAVKKLVTSYKLQVTSLYVVHDDLDIELGKYKIQFGKGPRQHNGLQSIYERLGSKEFWHVRLGIENRFRETSNSKLQIPNKFKADNDSNPKRFDAARISGEEYVLQKFTKEEREVIEQVVLEVEADLRKRLLEDSF
jgi:PTH1 family peptidyl-tRNA hydrolase